MSFMAEWRLIVDDETGYPVALISDDTTCSLLEISGNYKDVASAVEYFQALCDKLNGVAR